MKYLATLLLMLVLTPAMPRGGAGAPAPEYQSGTAIPTSAIVIGQAFNISVSVRNAGDASPDGRILIAFPLLDHPQDVQRVGSSTSGDLPGYREWPVGSSVADSTCANMTAGYLVAEYADDAWSGGEGNLVTVTVAPRDTGEFYFYIRTTMAVSGETCGWVNALPAAGEAGHRDQQGWSVKRFAVRVASTIAPIPSFSAGYPQISAGTVSLGQSFTIDITITNQLGGPSGDGRIVVGFPGFTDPADHQWVIGVGGDTPGYTERPAGSVLYDRTCQPVSGQYLVVEGIDDNWMSSEINIVSVVVRPKAAGTFVFETRATLNWTGLGPCEPITAVPSSGIATATDQQGFSVRRFQVNVLPAPPQATFTLAVDGIPAALTLGEAFTITTAARNDGTTGDGRIVMAFRQFDRAGDAAWATSTSSGDTPGYLERPAGTPLTRSNCASMTAQYLVTEYSDNSWEGLGAETNTYSVTVQPQTAGPFTVELRATMIVPGFPCSFTNTIPDGSGSIAVDQQGWTVRRFEVAVVEDVPPSVPPTTTWARITAPGGPAPRGNATAIYHPGRDALILYGGTDGEYQTDVWSLPLASGSGWTPLPAGGPVPLPRIMHSMIFNPLEDQVVLFAGLYDFAIGDVTTLALSPLVWWFPATPQGPQPSPRYGHAAVHDPIRHRMLVIGGFDGALLNDAWSYALPGTGAWNPLSPDGPPMPARALHAAVYDPLRDRVIVIGGDGGTFLNDVWELRLGGTPAWNRLTPSGQPPAGRRDHVMIYDPAHDRMVVFGGFGGTRLGDVWALTLAGEPTWERLYSTSPPPTPRSSHTAIHDPTRNRMLVFGGETAPGQYTNEVWSLLFDAPTPTLVSFAGAEVTAERVQLTWVSEEAAAIRAAVHRREEHDEGWRELGSPAVEGDRLVFEDRDIVPGTRYRYRLVADGAVLDEQLVSVPRAILALAGASPNPSPGAVLVRFSLPSGDRATLELFDLRGRLVAQREVGNLGAGAHGVALAEPGDLAAGVYLIRLVRGGQILTAKACVVR